MVSILTNTLKVNINILKDNMKLGKVYFKKFKDTRLRRKFAFFPKILSNNEMVWFEFYYSYQQYGPYGLAWAANNWRPDETWHEVYNSTTKKEIKEYIRIEYREDKRLKESTKQFFENLKV